MLRIVVQVCQCFDKHKSGYNYFDKVGEAYIVKEPSFPMVFLVFSSTKIRISIRLQTFIGLNGCLLNKSFGGMLLFVVSLDANNVILPLAIYICEG